MRKEELEWWRKGACLGPSSPLSDSASDGSSDDPSSSVYWDWVLLSSSSSSSSSSFSSSPYADEEELARGWSIPRARGVASAGAIGCARSKLWRDKDAAGPLLCGAMLGLFKMEVPLWRPKTESSARFNTTLTAFLRFTYKGNTSCLNADY